MNGADKDACSCAGAADDAYAIDGTMLVAKAASKYIGIFIAYFLLMVMPGGGPLTKWKNFQPKRNVTGTFEPQLNRHLVASH